MATQVILIRHGQTDWNVEPRFRGLADIPLNEAGVAQAEALARRLASEPIAAIYTSPLRRALHTAEIIARPHGLPVEKVPAFTSADYGEWEGMLVSEVARQHPDLFDLWRRHPEQLRFPGGESLDQVRDRAFRALMEILPRHPDQRIVVVTHQVVTRPLLCAALGLSTAHYWRLGQATACLNRLAYVDGVFHLLTLNDTCHLGTSVPWEEARA
ncbi:MAG: histidine phosphatase family protein [Anaerolineae bacterium]